MGFFNAKIEMKIIQIIALVLICICSSCTDDSCPEVIDLGELFWSQQTEDWLPDRYFTETDSLIFESENGDRQIFRKDETQTKVASIDIRNMLCENGGITSYQSRPRIFSTNYVSQDYLELSVSIRIFTKKSDNIEMVAYYEEIRMNYRNPKSNSNRTYGNLGIITDLENLEVEDIGIREITGFVEYDSIIINGVEYNSVLGAPTLQDESDLYFQKGIGIVGIRDRIDTTWRLIN